jgi:hypothetical protein
VLLVIDDFAPQGSPQDIAQYHAATDRVFRAAGKQAGRVRTPLQTWAGGKGFAGQPNFRRYC